MYKPLIALLPIALIPLTAGCRKQQPPPPPPTLVEAVLDAVRQPSPGQFPDAESAIRFLVAQLKAQDYAEATRVLPIVEHYRRVKMEDYAARLGGVMFRESPLPGADYHNCITALNHYVGQLDWTSRQLLFAAQGVDFNTIYRIEPGQQGAKQLAALSEKIGKQQMTELLDVLEIDKIESPADRGLQELPIDEIERALGVTEKKMFFVTIKTKENASEWIFFCGKIAGQWRVRNWIAQ